MRVALNLLPVGVEAGGIGRHAAELPAALLDSNPALDLTVFTGRELPRMPWEDGVRIVRLPFDTDGRATTVAQIGLLPPLGLIGRVDLLHSIGNVGPPRIPGLPSVITVHDLIWLHAGTDWGTAEAVAAMRRLAPRSARWATRVQADSEATARDVASFMRVPPARIDVVPLGVRAPAPGSAAPEAAVRQALDLGPAPVVLAVAQKRPYKNLDAAIRAMVDVPEATLVIPGARTPHEDDLRASAQRLGVAERVRFPDWIEDDVLDGLYGLAACAVVPSLWEGFGLPVLEAMARGVPVACAAGSSLPEVAGDAALLFDPHDDAAIGDAVSRLVRDEELRARLSAAGHRQVAEFSWQRCAQATLASYELALGES